jgi:hypothetical protein
MKKIYLLSCVLVFAAAGKAATKTFAGGASTLWESATNWSPRGIPGSGDDVIIPDKANVILSSSLDIQSLQLGVGAHLTIGGEQTLFIPQPSSTNPAIDMGKGAQLTVTGTLNIGSSQTANILKGINNAAGGDITVGTNGVVVINRCATAILLDNKSTFSSDGQISIEGATTGISLNNGGTLSNNGSLLIGQQSTINSQGILIGDGGSTLQNEDYGTINIDNVKGPAITTPVTPGSGRIITNSGIITIGAIGNITDAAISVTDADITSSGSIYLDGTVNGMELTRGTLSINFSTVSNGIFAGTVTPIAGSAIVAFQTTITNNGLMILKSTQADGLQLKGSSFVNNYWIRIGHYPSGGFAGSGNCGGIGIHGTGDVRFTNNNTVDFGIVSGNSIQMERGSQFTNAGSINGSYPYALGTNTAISGHIMELDASTFINTASGTYNAYNSTYNMTDTAFLLNNGKVQNNGTINIAGPQVGLSLNRGSDFQNYGNIQTSFGFRRVVYITSGSSFENLQGGTAVLGGIGYNANSAVAYITDAGSTLANSGTLQVKTANGGGSDGIELALGGLLQNNSTGTIDVSAIQGNGIEVTNGQVNNSGTISVNNINGVPLHLSGGKSSTNSGTINLGNNATGNTSTGILIEGTGTVFTNNASGQISVNHVASPNNGIQVTTAASLRNSGYITWGTTVVPFAGAAALNVTSGGIFDNRSTTSILEFVNCATDAITADVSTASGSSITFTNGAVKFGNIAGRGVYNSDATVVFLNNGTFMTMPGGGKMNLQAIVNNSSTGSLSNDDGTVTMGYAFSNSGTVTNGNVTNGTVGNITNTAAFTNASGGLIRNNGVWTMTGTFNNNLNAVCKGTGTFQGSVFNNAGTVAPGNSPGCLKMANGYLNQTTGTLDMEVNGKTTVCSDFDRLNVTGTATITGSALHVTFGTGYTGTTGDQVTILKSTSLTGTFSSNNLPAGWGVFYNLPATGDVTVAYLSTLPLTLIDFTVVKMGEKATASWTTTDEINVDHFELERSNGGPFQQVATIVATNTAGDHQYQFTDPFPQTGRNSYRLKMVDIDGKYTYSPVISISFDKAASMIAAIYPNPTKDILNIVVAETVDDLSVQVISQDGKIVLTKLLPTRGVHELSLSALSAGIYFIKTNRGDTYKLIKQ